MNIFWNMSRTYFYLPEVQQLSSFGAYTVGQVCRGFLASLNSLMLVPGCDVQPKKRNKEILECER